MNLSYLQTFLVVAEEKSFTKAATRLDVSKGLVSRHVKHLEGTLNSKLFHRTTRAINLTETGEELLAKAQQIKFLAKEAEYRVKEINQKIEGNLKITAPLEFGRALCEHVIPAFKQQHPNINLILNFGPEKEDIELGSYDIAYRAYNSLPNDVVAKRLGYIRNVIVCDPEWVNKNKCSKIEDIYNCEFILNGQSEDWNKLNLHNENQHFELEVTGTTYSNSYQSILELVLQRLGIASLPYYQVESFINEKRLTHLFNDWSIKTHPLSLIYAQRKVTPKKITAFNDHVKSWLCSSNQYLVTT